jgi:type VI secretion system protein ImpF
MPRRPDAIRFQHSLWDRLINPGLIRGEDVDVTPASEIESIKQEVRRDLEWLLNSRSPHLDIPPGLDALDQSLVRYGLPDFSTLNMGSSKAQERFQSVLEKVITDFEPRLDNVAVRVSLLHREQSRPSVHYVVEAVLKLEPTPMTVVFDTVLELGTKRFSVE